MFGKQIAYRDSVIEIESCSEKAVLLHVHYE
jgi:hypothetical protein